MKRILAGLVALGLALVGCEKKVATGDATASPERSSASNIVVGMSATVVTLDPADTSNTLDGGIQRLMMDGLFGFDRNMKVINLLATGYESNEEATEFTITLRKGISFSDGESWNADAAIANLDKLADQSLGLKRNGLFAMIDHTQKLDEYSIKIFLKYSFGAFVNTLAHPAGVMMSPKQIAAGQKECAAHPVGTGQYKFVDWRPGEFLKLELNPNWWGYDADICGGTPLVAKNAGFASITFKPIKEAATRVSMLQSGDADVIFPVPSESFLVLKHSEGITAESGEGITVNYLYMNTQKGALTDVRVRQAINYAVHRKAYVTVVKNDLSSVATSFIAPNVQFYKAYEPIEYDAEKAKALLAEAGYAKGLSLTCYTTNSSESVKAGEFIQQQLEAVNIDFKLIPTESATLSAKINDFRGEGKDAVYDLYLRGWSPSTGDADWVLRALFSVTMIPPHGSNYAYNDSPEYESYITAGLASANPEARREAYAKAQDWLWENVPAVAIANNFNTWAYGAHIQNVCLYPDGGVYLRDGTYTE